MLYSLRAWYTTLMNRSQTFGGRAALTAVALIVLLYFVTAAGAMYYRFKNGRSVYYDFKVCQFEKMNDEEEKNGIVFLGDSITDFCDLDTYYPGLNAVNRGIAGDMTVGVLRRMEASVFALEPRLVVLLIGVNDLSRGYSPETVTENIMKIVDEIKSRLPYASVIVQSVYPVNSVHGKEYASRLTPLIFELNAALGALDKEHGYVFVNVYPAIGDGTGSLIREYSDDGLHPNAAGYKAISSVLAPYLKEYSGI